MRNLQVIEPLSKNEYIALEFTKCWAAKNNDHISVNEMLRIYDLFIGKLYAKENNND